MQAHHTTRGWLAVEWHLGVGGISLLNFCNAYSSLHGNNHCPLPGDVYGSLPGNICQCPAWGTFAVPAWDACQFPAWETLASVHALPGHACSPCLGRLPVPCLGTLASSLPGNACQFPAWERLPVPCLGTFCSPCLDALPVPCLGTFANALPGHVCQSLPGNAFCRDAVTLKLKYLSTLDPFVCARGAEN